MASNEPDLQTDLRKRARRRLLGAIALALTAAIVLPVVMDHEPRPPAQDIVVRIPPRDNAPPLAPPARSDAGEVEVVIPPAPPDTESVAPARTESQIPAPVAKPAVPVTLPAAVAPPPAPAAVKPAAQKSPDAASAPAPAPAAPAVAGKAPAFALQLGVFSDASNVEKLRARAKEIGLPTFTENVKLADGQTRTRVKVGPFPNRAAAEAAQRKLEAAGLRSMIAPSA